MIVKVRNIILMILAPALLILSRPGLAQEKVFKLDEVIITATKTEHTLGDVPITAEVITKEEIEARNVKTVQDALKYLTGIKVNQTSGTWGDMGKIVIQGLDEKHTLILLDGQRILGGHGAAIDLQQISTAMVERIEIVQGPASALYGSDAVSGVINIITKSPPEEPTISASAALGTRKTQIYELNGGFTREKFGSTLNYTHRQSDGVNAETDEYREDILQGDLRYKFTPDLKLSLKPYYSLHKMDDEGRTQQRFSLSPVCRWSPDELSRLNVNGSWFNYKHWTSDKSSDWKTNSYEAEMNYSRLLLERHTLTGGYNYQKEDIDDPGKSYKAHQTTNSIFLQDESDFDPLIFVLGARLDDHDRWNTQFNPKVSLLFKLTEDLKLRGSVGRAFRGPTLVKLYGDDWRMGPYIVHANPDLKPEKSIGYQLGAECQFLEVFLGKLNFFRNDIEDLIDARIVSRGPPPWDMYWENVDEAYTQGAEVSLACQILENLTGRAGYTFLDTEDKETHKELPHRAKNTIVAELDWKIPEIELNLNLAGEYAGKRYDDAENTEKLGGYTVFDLALTKYIGEHLRIFARVDNIFNKKNVRDEYDIDGTEFLGGAEVKF